MHPMKYTRAEYATAEFQRSHNAKLHIAYVYNNRGQLLCKKTNRVASRSRGAGYSDYTIHAERAVLKALGDFTKLRGGTMVVVRYGILGNLQQSKPCHECERHLTKAIRDYGLRRIYYS
jgi:deoxycytidylate deaminase